MAFRFGGTGFYSYHGMGQDGVQQCQSPGLYSFRLPLPTKSTCPHNPTTPAQHLSTPIKEPAHPARRLGLTSDLLSLCICFYIQATYYYSSHSFRIGTAARLGISDLTIQVLDHWSSQASRMTRSDEDRDIGWDAWGTWSDCSRTCGGGASYSLRRCLKGGSCDGKNIRYRTCSNMDCPPESGDFRTQQCSAHNDIKYQGVTHEWVPAPYNPSAPCALRCQAKGRSLTIELAPKVLDGTRCRADAFDMCISGVCQMVPD
ncbi:hypothetical protein PAMP_001005 [Pampus punctatissimus]